MNNEPSQYESLRKEIADALYLSRVTARKSQLTVAMDLGMAQQQYGPYERDASGMKLETAVKLLEYAGYTLVVTKCDAATKLGRPADPNRKIKYTMANPPPGKKGLRIGGSLGFIWDDSKMHEWEEAERRVPEMPAPWPPGHPNWKPT